MISLQTHTSFRTEYQDIFSYCNFVTIETERTIKKRVMSWENDNADDSEGKSVGRELKWTVKQA